MSHREAIKEWLGNIELKHQNVVDWGSGSKPVSRYIKHTDCVFVTIDKNPLIDEDRRSETHIEWDITKPYSLATQSDTAFCIEVLEHTTKPTKVINNIWWNLKEGGKLYLSVPYNFRVHADDDYWRFTENGLKYLLRDFTYVEIKPSSGDEGFLVEAIL